MLGFFPNSLDRNIFQDIVIKRNGVAIHGRKFLVVQTEGLAHIFVICSNMVGCSKFTIFCKSWIRGRNVGNRVISKGWEQSMGVAFSVEKNTMKDDIKRLFESMCSCVSEISSIIVFLDAFACNIVGRETGSAN